MTQVRVGYDRRQYSLAGWCIHISLELNGIREGSFYKDRLNSPAVRATRSLATGFIV